MDWRSNQCLALILKQTLKDQMLLSPPPPLPPVITITVTWGQFNKYNNPSPLWWSFCWWAETCLFTIKGKVISQILIIRKKLIGWGKWWGRNWILKSGQIKWGFYHISILYSPQYVNKFQVAVPERGQLLGLPVEADVVLLCTERVTVQGQPVQVAASGWLPLLS